MGWCPKVADRASTMPAPRRPDRYMRLLAAPDNVYLCHNVGSGPIKYLEKQSPGWERQMAIARSKDPNRDTPPAVSELFIGGSSEPPAWAADPDLYIYRAVKRAAKSQSSSARMETFVLPFGTNGCSARSRTRRACSRSRSWNADRNLKTPTEEDCRQNELKTLLATYAREGYTVSTPFYTVHFHLPDERTSGKFVLEHRAAALQYKLFQSMLNVFKIGNATGRFSSEPSRTFSYEILLLILALARGYDG
ncbi:hypothetical protein T02_10803 [Trichinella nativa]|uniref:Uncharacterized protein n=1 Tax=Trichinella nativa TaxID=6335 RepID=A0A0V1KN97_9BILA|nr:hypothetical protein T02_10803 [Trichinella nativa]